MSAQRLSAPPPEPPPRGMAGETHAGVLRVRPDPRAHVASPRADVNLTISLSNIALKEACMAALSFLDRQHSIAPPGYSRWLIPPAALAVHLCIGQVYATSVYKTSLITDFGASEKSIGYIFSLAILMLGLSSAVFGKWVDLGGPRRAMFTAACCWSAGFLDRLVRHPVRAALAGLPRLRRHRRHRSGHRLHLSGVNPHQVVPGPAGSGHRYGDHGFRRWRSRRLAGDRPSCSATTARPPTRRSRTERPT